MLGVRVPPGLPFILYLVLADEESMINVTDKIKFWANKIKIFLTDARIELRKVTWPTRKQAIASTSVVILVVFVVSMFLGIVDFGLAKIIKLVLG
jgi:preprotein translocase subunit SecE